MMRRIVWSYDELFASDALLLGRITYDGFAATWPTMQEIEGDFAAKMKRLFEGASAPVALKLVDTRSFDSGVVALTYHAAD